MRETFIGSSSSASLVPRGVFSALFPLRVQLQTVKLLRCFVELAPQNTVPCNLFACHFALFVWLSTCGTRNKGRGALPSLLTLFGWQCKWKTMTLSGFMFYLPTGSFSFLDKFGSQLWAIEIATLFWENDNRSLVGWLVRHSTAHWWVEAYLVAKVFSNNSGNCFWAMMSKMIDELPWWLQLEIEPMTPRKYSVVVTHHLAPLGKWGHFPQSWFLTINSN